MELEQYHKSIHDMGEFYNIIHTTREEAERVGLEKGRAQERAEMAKKMLEAGMSIEQIAQFTTLTVEELSALQSEA